MTKIEAQAAMEGHVKVEGGDGEDYDAGYIFSIDGDMAEVGWDSGVSTPCAIADLSVVRR